MKTRKYSGWWADCAPQTAVKQRAVGEDFAGIPCEMQQQVKLFRREMDWLP